MRNYLLAMGLLINVVIHAQSITEIWQWEGTDSTKKILADVKKLDVNGNTVHEKMTAYLYSPSPYGGVSGENVFIYKDTFLMKYYFIGVNGDSIRREFEYDETGKLTREISSRRDQVNTEPTPSGMFTITNVAVDSTANTWVQLSEWNYRYDSLGRKKQIEISYVHSENKDHYIWTYDSQGRIFSFDFIMHGKPHFTERFMYAVNGRWLMHTYYDDKGKEVRKPGKRDPQYMQRKLDVTIYDINGRVIEERVEGSKGEIIERMVPSYNADGKLVREVWYDGEGKVVLTHVYEYK